MPSSKADYENTYSTALTVNILPKTAKKLGTLAKRRGTSRNQIVREAIMLYLDEIKSN